MNVDALLTLARTAATHAGRRVLTHYGDHTFEMKDDNTPVTKADTDAHETIISLLEESEIPVLSEESLTLFAPYPSLMWVVDPLDGTKGFINKTGDFAVMIALLSDGRPLLSVVDAPYMEKQYYALSSGGAFVVDKDGERRLRVSTRIAPHSRGLMSVNHAAPYMSRVMETLAVSEVVSIGSVGIKAGYIAEDKADFYVSRGALGEWDVCAPELILIEAGGSVTDEYGQLLSYGNTDHRIKHGLILSNNACHEEVICALKDIER